MMAPHSIPAALRALSQWVCWRYEERNGKRTKAPINARSNGVLHHAKTNDPATWSDFATALQTCERHPELNGVGFCFAKGDGLTGIDLDHVIHPDTGELTAEAAEILDHFQGTYAEISPSGTGLRLFCYGTPSRSGKNVGKDKWLEVYSFPSSRYLTLTGEHWHSSHAEVTHQQAALDWLHQRFMQMESTGEEAHSSHGPAQTLDCDDATLLEKARAAKNGPEFEQLWSGNTAAHHGDDSAADLALTNILAFWTNGNAEQIDRLFRQSGLMRPKWDSVRGESTYGQETIAKAVAGTPQGYSKKIIRRRDTRKISKSAVSSDPLFQVELLQHLPTVSACTHLANSYRIRHYYRERIWYALGLGWIMWTGQFWRSDPTSEGSIATGFIDGLSRLIASESAALSRRAADEADQDRRKALMLQAENLLKWAVQSENERTIASGLRLTKHSLLIDYAELNADPWLFNVQNGTIDLRTCTLRPHDPANLITFISPVTYDPTATCPTWERFLSEVFADNQDMVAFIQRAVGWSLTGVVKERALFFLYGDTGKNGKTTLVEVLMKLVGICGESSYGYGRKVGADTFMKSKNIEDNQRKASTLAGPRFICTSEVDEEHRLNEQLIKDITGGDTIEGRRLYQEPFTFKPQFKPWMYGNHKPEIRGTDDAIWSRVRLIPFEVSFLGREDLDLPVKLEAELSGILNWALRGCLSWQQIGLQPPAKVQAATAAYREEMDVFGPFIRECCVIHRNAEVWANDLWSAYKGWCADSGMREQTQNKLGRYLRSKGFITDESSGRVKRLGLGLRARSDHSDHSDLIPENPHIDTPYSDFLEKGQKGQKGQESPPVDSLPPLSMNERKAVAILRDLHRTYGENLRNSGLDPVGAKVSKRDFAEALRQHGLSTDIARALIQRGLVITDGTYLEVCA